MGAPPQALLSRRWIEGSRRAPLAPGLRARGCDAAI